MFIETFHFTLSKERYFHDVVVWFFARGTHMVLASPHMTSLEQPRSFNITTENTPRMRRARQSINYYDCANCVKQDSRTIPRGPVR